ncbi:hypothetical protein, partial [Vreelandella olivaria]|uniref:hypothetical protein n=1 Tax=Vreelandella olivaria TaxID=390919 RepID=UPI00201E7D3D
TLAAGGTGLVLGPMTSGSIIGNAIVGGAAGGAHTSATNWMYDESRSVGQSMFLGGVTSGAGTAAGNATSRFLQDIPRQVVLPYLGTPATVTVPLPSSDFIGGGIQTVIGNIPSFFTLPEISIEAHNENN